MHENKTCNENTSSRPNSP